MSRRHIVYHVLGRFGSETIAVRVPSKGVRAPLGVIGKTIFQFVGVRLAVDAMIAICASGGGGFWRRLGVAWAWQVDLFVALGF